jgi:signal transduction histidine kinase
VLALAAVAAATATWLAITSDHLDRPAATALYKAYLSAAPMLVGLVWWRRRPNSRFGPLLVALGVCGWGLALQSANAPGLYAFGVAFDLPFIVLNFGLCLAFPQGRLGSTLDRILVAVFALAIAQFFVAWYLLAPWVQGGGPLSQCVPACPPNPLQLGSAPALLSVLGEVETWIGLAVTVGVLARVLWRLRTGSRPQRRALAAVAATSLLLLPAFFAYHLAADIVEAGDGIIDVLAWILVGTRVIFPLGFLIALLQAELFATGALRRLLGELSGHPTPERWRDAIADALDDPGLGLGFWDPVARRFRDVRGATLRPPADRETRWWAPIERDGRPIAVMVLDDALHEDPELVAAAAQATLVAVDHGDLEAELRASRARLVEAADEERRRLQRDLHDSAQQRLIALRVQLGLTSELLDDRPEGRELISALGDQVDAALEELRNIAHGLYPAVLARHGVGEALRSACRRAALPVRVIDRGIQRQAQTVENTMYFCCLEAVQNAAKHAGDGAKVTIVLASGAGEASFLVEDDGAGFDPDATQRGGGITNIADRLAALDGTLRLDSVPGAGTRLHGVIPLSSAG